MKHFLPSGRISFFLSILFVSLGAFAQTHTPKTNIPIGTKCNGYYEYLPLGYDPNAKTTYPVIFFLTGIGEMGDGTPAEINRILLHGIPKLIHQGTLPTSFTVNGRTSKFIIITPQFKQGSRPAAVNVNEVIDYMLPRYKINRNRIYLAGLSYGGGLCWAHPGYNTTYANRIAAIVPVASPPPSVPSGQTQDQVIYTRSRNIASSNVAVWALHNRYDAGNPVSVPQTYIKYINQAPAPTPLAKLTIFEQSGHGNTWPKAFSPTFRENALNVYEWMLQFHNGKPAIVNAGTNKNLTLPSNRVTMTASASDADGYIERYYWTKISGPTQYSISSRSILNPTISNLTAGTYTFRLTVTDNDGATSSDDVSIIVSSGSTTTKSVKVNLFGGTNPYANAEWNNWNVSSSLTSGALRYSNSTASSVTASITRHTLADNGSTYGGTMAPPEVLRYTSYATTARTLTFSGLSTSKTYNLELYASRANTGNSTRFTVNGTAKTVLTDHNKTNKVSFSSLVPTAGGQLVVSIANVNSFNYLNGFTLTEGAPPPPPATKAVKVNLFGGSNPYSNTQWNNWNVSGSLNSGTLKYSDASSSSVSASITKHTLADNGATYGGTMAPAEVLRYTSYATTARSLTISGLSTTKTYNLELYASRANTGNSTRFTINGTVVTILTDNNKTNKASFNGLTPNSSGQIIVSISNVNSFNYLNGFVLTEGGTVTAGTTSVGGTNEETVTILQGTRTNNLESNPIGLQVRAYPNPSSHYFSLIIRSFEPEPINLRLMDVAGRMIEVRQNVPANMTIILGRSLKPGTYYIEVMQGKKRSTVSVVRTAR